jgi:hypothetical protein
MTDRPPSIGTTAAAPTMGTLNDSLRGLAVLIVEDDELMANELRTLISGGGGSVLPAAPDGDTALTMLQESRPDAFCLTSASQQEGHGSRPASAGAWSALCRGEHIQPSRRHPGDNRNRSETAFYCDN